MRRKYKNERKIFVKTPVGRNKISYKAKCPETTKCGDTGKSLMGIPRVSAFGLRKVNMSKKRVNRKYGGQLSSGVSRRRIIEFARKWLK